MVETTKAELVPLLNFLVSVLPTCYQTSPSHMIIFKTNIESWFQHPK